VATTSTSPGREVPAELPRVDFFPLGAGGPAGGPGALPKASSAAASRPRQARAAGARATARHGLNDYTGWFAGDAAMAGNYFGYDGPFPPFNDSLMHHYVFTLYAWPAAAAG
jgi:hypothetical protein